MYTQVAPDDASLPSALDFTYSQDGGQAVQQQLDWAAAASSQEAPPVAFGDQPACLDYAPPGFDDAAGCQAQVRGGMCLCCPRTYPRVFAGGDA